MTRSMEKELRELDVGSEYQKGYRDGWLDALRVTGVVPPWDMHRVERIITEATERVTHKMGEKTHEEGT